MNKGSKMQRIVGCLLLVLFSLTLIQGCATKRTDFRDREAYRSDPRISVANDVILAAGMNKIRDAKLTPEQAAKLKAYRTRLGDVVPRAVLDIGVQGYTNFLGLGHIGSAGVTALTWLIKPTDAAKENWLIVWMRMSEATDLEDARQKVSAMTVKAVGKVLSSPEYAGFEAYPDKYDLLGGEFVGFSFPSEKWPECAPIKYDARPCLFGAGTSTKPVAPIAPRFFGGVLVNAPDFVSPNGEARYLIKGNALDKARNSGANRLPTLNSLDIWRRVSEQLPEYAYIYLAPRRYGFARDDGKVVTGGAPLVLNRGRIMLFAVPGKEG